MRCSINHHLFPTLRAFRHYTLQHHFRLHQALRRDRHLLGLAPWLPYLPRKRIAPQIEIRRNGVVFVSEKSTYKTHTLLGFLSPNHAIFGASAN
jgi:hypothetical protein